MSTNIAPPELDLRTYLRILRRRKWWVIVCTGLAVVGAIAYAFSATKEYAATAQLLVQPQNATLPLTSPAQTITTTDVATELQLLSSAPVVDAVKRRLHLSQLNVASAEQGQTDVISVTATNPNPTLAARVANGYATDFVDYETFVALKGLTTSELQLQSQINAIEQELPATTGSPQGDALANQLAVLKEEYAQYQVDGAATTGGVTVTSSASVPKAPSSPKKVEIVLIGLAVGLMVGLGAAFVAENLDDAIRSRDDLEHVTPDVPIMGLVPMIGSWRDRADPFLVMRAEPTSPAAEAYRSLRTSLQFAAYDNKIASVLVTSPTATEGKTSTVANLGVVLATAGQHVVLVSADLRRPRLATFFGLDEGVGLTSVMIGESTLDEALRAVPDIPGLAVLGCGPVPPNPAELLSSPKLAEIFDQLKAKLRHGPGRQLTAPARNRSRSPVPIDRYHLAHCCLRADHQETTQAGRRAARPSWDPTGRDRAERGDPPRKRRRRRVRLLLHLPGAEHVVCDAVLQRPPRSPAARVGSHSSALGPPRGGRLGADGRRPPASPRIGPLQNVPTAPGRDVVDWPGSGYRLPPG